MARARIPGFGGLFRQQAFFGDNPGEGPSALIELRLLLTAFPAVEQPAR